MTKSDQVSLPEEIKRSDIFAWAGILAILIFAVISRSLSITNSDVSWLLYMASQTVDGATLYVDLIEVNPPLIVWLMTPSVFLAKFMGMPMETGLRIYLFAIAALSLILTYRLVLYLKILNPLIFFMGVTLSLTVLPGMDFGEREHLMVLLIFPYLLLVVARRENVAIPIYLVVMVSILAAFGAYLKPHFLLIPASLQLHLMISLGWRRTAFNLENIIFTVLGLGYLCAVILITPEYFSRIIPYGIEVYSAGYQTNVLQMATRILLEIITIIFLAIWFFSRRVKTFNSLTSVLIITLICTIIIFVVQWRGFSYHAYPVRVLTVMSVLAVIFQLRMEFFGKILRTVPSIFLAYSAVLIVLFQTVFFKFPHEEFDHWRQEIAKNPGTNSILIMSFDVFQGFPIVTDQNLVWASRFPCFWLVPGLVSRRDQLNGTTPLLDEIEQYTRQAVAEDLVKFEPQLVFVDVREEKFKFKGHKFDFIEDFSNNELFQDVWKYYSKVDTSNGFEIYKRNGLAKTER